MNSSYGQYIKNLIYNSVHNGDSGNEIHGDDPFEVTSQRPPDFNIENYIFHYIKYNDHEKINI